MLRERDDATPGPHGWPSVCPPDQQREEAGACPDRFPRRRSANKRFIFSNLTTAFASLAAFRSYLRQKVLRSVVFVSWLVGSFVDLFVRSSHPATSCNGRCAAGGSAAGERQRCAARLAEVAPYERFFLVSIVCLSLLYI